jgi:phage antirepressor YoqD-like protein
VKTYSVAFEEDKVVREIEETAKVAKVKPEELIAWLVARAVASHSVTAQKLCPEPQY